MLQTAISVCWTIGVTGVLGVLAVIVSLFPGSDNWVHRIARMWGRSILGVSRVRVAVRGLSRIDTTRPYVFMSNHQSNFDIPVLLAHLPVQFRWLAKAELFRIPVFGRGMKGAGYISIDRADQESAKESLATAAERVRDGVSVLIFPEGTRSRDGRLLPFKKGGFFLAIDAGVPIVPIVITGTVSVMAKGRLRIRPGAVSVDVLAPIQTSGFRPETKDDLLMRVRAAIQKGIVTTPTEAEKHTW